MSLLKEATLPMHPDVLFFFRKLALLQDGSLPDKCIQSMLPDVKELRNISFTAVFLWLLVFSHVALAGNEAADNLARSSVAVHYDEEGFTGCEEYD